ncbi:MAG: helix-turn-helix domain-containing protein [Patescibacteria group bacterium]
MEDKKAKTDQKRIAKNKKEILALLSELDNISIVCKKAGVSRATFYRWIEEDMDLADEVTKARKLGRAALNDLAKSALTQKIKEGNMQAIVFQLKSRDPEYTPKVPTKDVESFVPVHSIIINETPPETIAEWALKLHKEMAEEEKGISE